MNEIDKVFLKQLQQELKNQPNDGNADPVFWMIAQYEYVPTSQDYADDTHYFDGENSYETFASVLEILKESDYFNHDTGEYESTIHFLDYTTHKDRSFNLNEIFDWSDLPNALREKYKEVPVMKVHKIMSNSMFITKSDAIAHLKSNAHHYNKTAHTYALTAWRSPSVDKLWKLLREVDFDAQ